MRASQKTQRESGGTKKETRGGRLTSLGVAEGGNTDAVDLGLDKGSVLRRRFTLIVNPDPAAKGEEGRRTSR